MVLLLSRTTLASAHVFHSGLHGPDPLSGAGDPPVSVVIACFAKAQGAGGHTSGSGSASRSETSAPGPHR